MITFEVQLENAKQTLTKRPDFNLHDAYTIFDRNHKGHFSQAELKDGLAAIGVYPTSEELTLFFKHYDTDRNKLLNF